MAGELTSAEYAYLIILKAENREISNSELHNLYEVRILSPDYEKLNADGYIETHTKPRPYRHQITDKGVKALADALTIEQGRVQQGEKRPSAQLLWAAMVAQHKLIHLPAADPAPALEATRPAAVPGVEQPADLDGRIRAAYTQLAGESTEWVNLTALRPLLADISKADLDLALEDMLDDPEVRLEPEPFGHRVGAAERRAAVHIGGEDRHKLSIGPR